MFINLLADSTWINLTDDTDVYSIKNSTRQDADDIETKSLYCILNMVEMQLLQKVTSDNSKYLDAIGQLSLYY